MDCGLLATLPAPLMLTGAGTLAHLAHPMRLLALSVRARARMLRAAPCHKTVWPQHEHQHEHHLHEPSALARPPHACPRTLPEPLTQRVARPEPARTRTGWLVGSGQASGSSASLWRCGAWGSPGTAPSMPALLTPLPLPAAPEPPPHSFPCRSPNGCRQALHILTFSHTGQPNCGPADAGLVPDE